MLDTSWSNMKNIQWPCGFALIWDDELVWILFVYMGLAYKGPTYTGLLKYTERNKLYWTTVWLIFYWKYGVIQSSTTIIEIIQGYGICVTLILIQGLVYPTRHYIIVCLYSMEYIPDSKVHGASMGPIWGRQDPGGPHVGPMNFAIWDVTLLKCCSIFGQNKLRESISVIMIDSNIQFSLLWSHKKNARNHKNCCNTSQIARYMGPTWVLSAPCWPH